MTMSRNISINSEQITNFHFNNTKYNFVTRNQIVIDSTKLQGGQA